MSLLTLFEAHPYWAYPVLFLGSYFETIIGFGFFIYGEVFFLSGSILAGLGYLNVWYVAIACILGGLLGDNSSYFIGRKYGSRAVKRFFKDTNRFFTLSNYKASKKFFNKHGKKTIFFARFLGPISWVTPFLAGTLKVKYKDFLKYNTPATILGIGIFIIAGYLFGFSYAVFLSKIFKDLIYIFLVIIIVSVYFILSKLQILKSGKFKITKD